MNELQQKKLELINRKNELKEWLDDVEEKLQGIEFQIAISNKLIRFTDFMVKVESPKGLLLDVGNDVTVIHLPTGYNRYCSLYKSQHKNKAAALEDLVATLKEEGWGQE